MILLIFSLNYVQGLSEYLPYLRGLTSSGKSLKNSKLKSEKSLKTIKSSLKRRIFSLNNPI